MFLKKLFQRNKDSDQANITRKIVARAPRVRISPLHHIRFVLEQPFHVNEVLISNISSSGVGFLRSSLTDWPESGTELTGDFVFGDSSCGVRMRIIQNSSQVIGCAFINPSAELKHLVQKYFKWEIAAVSVVPVNPQMLRPETDGIPHLFRGEHNCELYYVEAGGRVLRFSLSFFGNYFEWNAGSELKFGHFLTDMSTEGVAYSASDPIQWEKDVPREMGEAAVKFVENIASLERTHRTYLIDQIRTAAKLF